MGKRGRGIMRKRSLIVIVGLIVAAFFMARLVSAADTKPIEIKLGTSGPVNKITLTTIEGAGLSSEHTVAEVFKSIVEERSGGQLLVKIYPDSQLGDEREQWQSMKEGSLQMSTSSCEPLAGFVKEWMAFSIPYLTDSEEVLLKVLEGATGKAIE
jgi:TRAP-type C4-dicarboxylate transport system substrate-binding protein